MIWSLACVKKKWFSLTFFFFSSWCFCIACFFLVYPAIWEDFIFDMQAEYWAFCQYLLPGDDAQKHLHVKSHWELSLYAPGKCINISGWSLDITSPVQQGAAPDDAPWVGMWWHSHLEDVCSGCLWWGTVLIISGTSGWVCKVYPTGVWHQQNSYRQWAERGLGFCLREKT